MYGATPQETHRDATPEDEHMNDATIHPRTEKHLALCTPPSLLGLKGAGGAGEACWEGARLTAYTNNVIGRAEGN